MISTTCEACKFKVSLEGTQIGCQLDLLERFKESGAEITTRTTEGETSFVINRVCQSRRNKDWKGDIYSEIFIPITIVVTYNGSPKDLKQSLYCIRHLSAPKRPRVIVCHGVKDSEVVSEIIKDDKSSSITRIMIVEELYTDASRDEAFKRCKNGWVLFTKSGEHLEPETLEILNFAINYRMGTFVAVSGLECFMAVVYKYLRGQMGGSIFDKLKELGDDSIADWSDLEEDYRLFYE